MEHIVTEIATTNPFMVLPDAMYCSILEYLDWGDVGTQYASVIYYHDETQKRIATMVRDQLQEYINDGTITCFIDTKVATVIKPATVFYIAKEEHQEYLLKNPKGYCNHRVRFKAWPDRRVKEK